MSYIILRNWTDIRRTHPEVPHQKHKIHEVEVFFSIFCPLIVPPARSRACEDGGLSLRRVCER